MEKRKFHFSANIFKRKIKGKKITEKIYEKHSFKDVRKALKCRRKSLSDFVKVCNNRISKSCIDQNVVHEKYETVF